MYRRSLLALTALPFAARAQTFPDRPVTMIVPYAPGGSADVLGRVVAPAMAEFLGQPVVVELRPGAGGNIGAAYVATNARADGHTILLGSLSLASAPALQSIAFDPTRELVAIGGLGAVASLLVVAPDSPFRSVADLLAATRARPEAVTYGSSGPATGSHLAGALLAAQSGVALTHVPYRGSGAVYPDLIAGRIAFLLDGMGSSAGQVSSGAVRALGITSLQRSAQFPDVPTLAEAGIPGFEFLIWLGFFARTGTPEPARARLEAALVHAMSLPAVQEKLRQSSTVPLPPTRLEFGRWYAEDVARWKDLVRQGKLARLD